MSFPFKVPSSLPPGLKLGVFAGGGPFPRLVAPGIAVDDPIHLSPSTSTSTSTIPNPNPNLSANTGAANANAIEEEASPLSSPYTQLGLTHVLMRASRATQLHLHLPPNLSKKMKMSGSPELQLVLIRDGQTLREVVEVLVRVRVARPHGRILIFGEPYVAVAYLMAIEGRDLKSTWRVVTGDSEALASRGVLYREVQGVLGKFARDVEEEGKKVAREEEEREMLQLKESEQPSQSRRKRGKKMNQKDDVL
jgi:hypothetical protein